MSQQTLPERTRTLVVGAGFAGLGTAIKLDEAGRTDFVVVDKGAAASLTSTSITQDVYAVPFGQRGLMAGIGLEGSKITHIHPGS